MPNDHPRPGRTGRLAVQSTRRGVTLLIAFALALGLGLTAGPAAQAAPTCTPILITVNGTSEQFSSSTMDTVRVAFKNTATHRGIATTWVPVDYPAVPVEKYVVDYNLAHPTRLRLGPLLDVSELQGVKDLQKTIAAVRTPACPGRDITIVGYSQGADVIQRTLLNSDAGLLGHLFVGLMGDPSFVPRTTSRCPGLVRCGTEKGIRFLVAGAGLTFDVAGAAMRPRYLSSVCIKGDPICSFSVANAPALLQGIGPLPVGHDPHFDYVRGAAQQLGADLASALPHPTT